MKIFIWIVAILLLTPWTAGAWLAYALIDVSGDWMSGNADVFAAEPQIVETMSWLARVMAGMGETVVFVVWAIGTAIIALVAWLFCKLIDRDRRIKSMNWHPEDPRAMAQRIP